MFRSSLVLSHVTVVVQPSFPMKNTKYGHMLTYILGKSIETEMPIFRIYLEFRIFGHKKKNSEFLKKKKKKI